MTESQTQVIRFIMARVCHYTDVELVPGVKIVKIIYIVTAITVNES